MRKSLCCLIVMAILAALLPGCVQISLGVFTANNEIYTYEKIDLKKTQLVISRTGNLNVKALCDEFEELNPDIQVIYLDITGGNAGYAPLKDWVTEGYAPDVIITGAEFFDDALTVQYFENLSADPIIQNYETAALQRTATDNAIYWLPGPSELSAMMYNKTMFKQYGWQVPTTFDEFVALCDQIRADTNGEVEPWNPNAKYSDELTAALQCITYSELFAGVDNYAWYNELFTGEATLAGHMEPYTEVIQTLIDHDILREEHFSYSATTRGKEFAAGKIAMINAGVYDADNESFDFGYMPFPTTQGELGYLCSKYSCFVGLPIKQRSARSSDAAHRFLEYFSSPQGQMTYIGNTIKVSTVKGLKLSGGDDLAALQAAIDAGHQFSVLDFSDPATKESRVYLHQMALKMATEGKSGQASLAELDAKLAAPVKTVQKEQPEILAKVEKNMTILETSFYIADAYRNAAGADIGLITHNAVFRGNAMRLFAGDLPATTVTVLKPRSFANDSSLVKLSMTGQQLMDALNNPVGNNLVENCIYAYSGLKCEVAPWKELGSKYLSVKLADGSALIPDKLYTVAAWSGTIADAYITETLETYAGSWEEIMSAQLRFDGTITPANDERIKISWR